MLLVKDSFGAYPHHFSKRMRFDESHKKLERSNTSGMKMEIHFKYLCMPIFPPFHPFNFYFTSFLRNHIEEEGKIE